MALATGIQRSSLVNLIARYLLRLMGWRTQVLAQPPARCVLIGAPHTSNWDFFFVLLLMAAERTQGLLREPAPFVLQKSLDDFYVTYELNVYTDTPHMMAELYSDIHKNIQDCFNEYGVQIMSPNYVADRSEPTIVLKERWFAAPADASEGSE